MHSGDVNKQVAGSADPIIPIDFSPNDSRGESRSFRLKWSHGIFAVFALVFGSAAWFVLTARSVFVEVDPFSAAVEISGGLNFRVGPRYLIRTGTYDLRLTNPGYRDTETQLLVSNDQAQTHSFTMQRLPGIVSIGTIGVEDARVQLDGIDIGTTPLLEVPVEAGEHRLTISKDRYLEHNDSIEIEGRSVEQRFQVELNPAWAVVSINTNPQGAEVLVDGQLVGHTPINTEILQGERDLVVKLPGHKAWQEQLDIIAGEDFSLPPVELEPADGLVFIRSNPNAASVTIDGEFKGLTPLEVNLTPNEDHLLTFFKNGYQQLRSTVRTQPEQEREISVELDPVTASVQIVSQPEDAELYVNGEYRGLANQTLELMAASQQIEVRRDGYLPFNTEFTSRPGLDQVIRVTLKSLEMARLEQIQPVITNPAGQVMKLLYPGAFTMGASRREAGRRPNETLRDIQLERPFYLSYREVSNAEFRRFDPEHSSGTVQGVTLNNQAQPVVRVTWAQAALFCNWLSEQEGLPLFYQVTEGEVTG
ncbi:MAG: PEGA domain-containing protein, partial [Gammaproteobacteria bacterium]